MQSVKEPGFPGPTIADKLGSSARKNTLTRSLHTHTQTENPPGSAVFVLTSEKTSTEVGTDNFF